MNPTVTPPQTFANPHIAWLVCLYTLLRQIRREGLMSIEADVENATSERSVFHQFPQTLAAPYLEFATDILRLMVGGTVEADTLTVYAEHYRSGFAQPANAASPPDQSLLNTIWLCLWSSVKGHVPQIAAEFGRQGIPSSLKPSFTELETLLKDSHRQITQRGLDFERGGMEAAIDRFIASLD